MPMRPPTSPSPTSTTAMALRNDRRKPIDHALTERVQPCERRRAAPGREKRDRPFAIIQFEPLQHRSDRGRDGSGFQVISIQRHVGRDHRHIAQGQDVQRRNEDRAARHLGRVLRGANDGGANAFGGFLQPRPPFGDAGADFGRQQRTEITEIALLTAINEFRNTAGDRDLRDAAARDGRGDRAATARTRRPAVSRPSLRRRGGRIMRLASARPPSGFERRTDGKIQSSSSAANWRPASSIRTTRPWCIRHDQPRPDIDRGDVRDLAAPRKPRSSEVPPPISIFITATPSRMELVDRTPNHRPPSRSSRLSSALTATSLPVSLEQFANRASAFFRRTATPVRIRAPVLISSRRDLSAYSYCLRMKAPNASASIVSSSVYGSEQGCRICRRSPARSPHSGNPAVPARSAKTPDARWKNRYRRHTEKMTISSSPSSVRPLAGEEDAAAFSSSVI